MKQKVYTGEMKTVVGVLRGGPSSEYEVSLKTGATILAELDQNKYEPRDLFISKTGEWHHRGVIMMPEKALRGVDVVFNAMHGQYGEDGTVQQLLDILGIPYTGSGSFASALTFNKEQTKNAVAPLGIRTVRHVAVGQIPPEEIEGAALKIFRSFPMPVVIKPVTGGSSVAVTIARDFQTLAEGLQEALAAAPKALVEEYIKGKEATVGVVDGFRGQKTYVLMPIEIIPPKSSDFFDYTAKYSGETQEICPGNFTAAEKRELMDMAQRVHEGLNLSHYSRSDFIVSSRGIYFLEVNTLPGITNQSLVPKALQATGIKLSEFLDHVINLARN